MALNEKQEKFAQAYVLHHNATEAAKAAGYSATSANNQGYRLMHLQEIIDRVHELEQQLETDVNVIHLPKQTDILTVPSKHLSYCPVFVDQIVIPDYLQIRRHWRLLLLVV